MKICENCNHQDSDENLLCSKCGSWLKLIPGSVSQPSKKVVAKTAVKTLVFGFFSVLIQYLFSVWFLLTTGFSLIAFKPFTYGQFNLRPTILESTLQLALWFTIPLILALSGLKNARETLKTIKLYPERYQGKIITFIGYAMNVLSLLLLTASLFLTVYWFFRSGFFTR